MAAIPCLHESIDLIASLLLAVVVKADVEEREGAGVRRQQQTGVNTMVERSIERSIERSSIRTYA